jgi:hypothetical protein
LEHSLRKYAAQRLTLDQRVLRLNDQHKLIIGQVTVFVVVFTCAEGVAITQRFNIGVYAIRGSDEASIGSLLYENIMQPERQSVENKTRNT